jgi:hypothetical protein
MEFYRRLSVPVKDYWLAVLPDMTPRYLEFALARGGTLV